MEFLQTNEIENAIDDNPKTLTEHFKNNEVYLISQLGEERYKR